MELSNEQIEIISKGIKKTRTFYNNNKGVTPPYKTQTNE